jgi:hypothetical protein
MLKKLSASLSFVGVLFVTISAVPLGAFAAGFCPNNDTSGANFSGLCSLKFSDNTFGMIITIVFIVAILLALAYLIWGGIKWVLSGGDKAKVDSARQAIIAAIIGLVLVFLAYFIINIVVPIFVPNFSLQTIQLPSINQGNGGASIPAPVGPVDTERGCIDNGGQWINGSCSFAPAPLCSSYTNQTSCQGNGCVWDLSAGHFTCHQ